jgi:hypothetical protein
MDKEQARFILRSFRPDGADVGDPDFAEALKLAMENRELGEWLAAERAFDAEFAIALGVVNMPENLREDIIACLATERGDYPQAEDSNDAAWIGAMASIQPPASLRNEVLAAMDRTVTKESDSVVEISIFRRAAIPLAAAAGIALAFLITRPEKPADVVKTQIIPIETVQAGFLKTYESPTFDLEEKRGDHQALVRHLIEGKLPSPTCMPPGLKEVKGLGCRELLIDGKRGSLICFMTGVNGVVHLLIFRREDISGDFPTMDHPSMAQEGKWATARWQEGGNVYLVLGITEVAKLTALF